MKFQRFGWVESGYPLVNVYITMENHHFSWVIPLFQWPCSIAFWCFFYVYQAGEIPSVPPIYLFSSARWRKPVNLFAVLTKPVEAETDECRLKAQQAQELMKELKARSWGFWIFEKWVWVRIGYPNHWMVNLKMALKSVVPQVFNFDAYPNGTWILWRFIPLKYS